MLGLLDRLHGTVVFHRFCDRCRSSVTDGVQLETARFAMNTNRRFKRDSVRLKSMSASREERKRIADGRRGERDDLNAWLTRCM